jgi:nucleotide-binding universal stress UspA family protein
MKILVCTDGSKESERTLEEAVKLVENCESPEVSLIHVYSERITFAHGDEVRTRDELEKLMEGHRQAGEALLEKARQFFAEQKISVKTILKKGHPVQAIVNTANEENFDLIVIGSRGLGGLKRLFLGSVSNAVMQEAKTNVLVVK